MADKYNAIPDDEPIVDNRGWLPGWWMTLFWGAIVFSIGFWVYFHEIEGWNQHKQYTEEVEAHKEAHPELYMKAELTEEGVNPFRGNEKYIAEGQKLFTGAGLCAACHKNDATGNIGPNLTDAEWQHGNTDRIVHENIMTGIGSEGSIRQTTLGKGAMPAKGGGNISEADVLKIMAWLASINPDLKDKE